MSSQDEIISLYETRIQELETALLALRGSKHTLLRVMEFHQAFHHPIRTVPQVPSFEERQLRVNLIVEEVGEFIAASGMMNTWAYSAFQHLTDQLKHPEHVYQDAPPPNMVEAADALADIDYVVQGANLVWGFPAEAIGEEVHKSNMSKLGLDGQPIHREDGKVLKGPNYFKPRISAILFPNEDIEKIEKQQGITILESWGPGELFPKNPLSAPHPSE